MPIEKLNAKIPALSDEKAVMIKIPGIDEVLIHARFYFENLKEAEAKFPLPYSICHGDLHAKNILVNKDSKESWLIDFAYTGYAYTFIDHASLENSIKFDVLGFCPLNHYYILEKNLMEQTAYSTKITPSSELEELGNRELLNIFEIVKTIREDAAQIRNYYGNFDDFYYTLLYLNLFYLTFTDKNLNNYLRALVSSSLLYEHLFRQEFNRLEDEKPFALDITNLKTDKDGD